MSFTLPSVSFVELMLRLLSAVLLGASLGWERERRAKPAGLRTHMMVTLGAAAFTVLGTELMIEMSPHEHARPDPTRVVEGIIGGIGFLGAGSIIQSRGNVEGLTTAAGVWVAGGIGAACGAGMYSIAAAVTGLSILTLWTIGVLERFVRPTKSETERDGE